MEEYKIDLKKILSLFLKKLPIIISLALIVGIAAFVYGNFFATPIYSANVKFYLNNQQGLSDSIKMQNSDIITARSLVNSYTNLIYTDLVMDEVAAVSGLGYTAGQLRSMISASAVDDEAPIFIITVNNPYPEHAQMIANTLANVAPGLIQGVIHGSDAEVVDLAKLPEAPVSPNVRKLTMIGLVLGFLLGVGLVILTEALDTRVKNSDYLTQRFDFPVLGVIPDIASELKISQRQATGGQNK